MTQEIPRIFNFKSGPTHREKIPPKARVVSTESRGPEETDKSRPEQVQQQSMVA